MDLFPYDKIDHARSILKDAVEKYRPIAVVALMSGGNDSHCAAHLAWNTVKVDFTFKIDTQTGIRQTNEFVERKCREYGWPLVVKSPPIPKKFGDGIKHPISPAHPDAKTAYEAMVYEFGFPGPIMHGITYNLIKERCLRALKRELIAERGDGVIMLVSGVRKSESTRRMGRVVAVSEYEKFIWAAPIIEWEDSDKRAYMKANALEESEVAKRLCMSGECLCGAFAKPEEFAEIKNAYPESAAYLEDLQARVKAAGQPRWKWGDKDGPKIIDDEPMPLFGACWSCCARAEDEAV